MEKHKVWLKRIAWLVILWFLSVLLIVVLSLGLKFVMTMVGYKS